MSGRDRTDIAKRTGRKNIIHDRAGRRRNRRRGQRYGFNRGSGRGPVTRNTDNGSILVSVVRCELQIGGGIGVENRASNVGPGSAAILADLPLESRTGTDLRFYGQNRAYFRAVRHVRRWLYGKARGKTLAIRRRYIRPTIRANAQFIKIGAGTVIH